jgi:hypothetical protein
MKQVGEIIKPIVAKALQADDLPRYKLAVYDRYGVRRLFEPETFDIAKHAADAFMLNQQSPFCVAIFIRDATGQLIYAADRHEEYCAP